MSETLTTSETSQLELPFTPEHAPAPPAPKARFEDYFCQLCVRQSRWHGEHVLKGAVTVIDGNSVDKNLTKVTIKLIPDDWMKKFNSVYGAIDSIIVCYSIPFGSLGRRILPVHSYSKFMQDFSAARARLLDTVAEFAEAYETDVVDAARETWLPKFSNDRDKYYRSIGHLLPRVADLPLKFSVDVELYEAMAAANTDRYNVTTAELKQFLETSRNNAASAIEDAIRDAFDSPIRKLTEALSELGQSIRTPGFKIRPGSFNATLDAIRMCRTFSDVTAKHVLDKLNVFEATINRTVADGTAAMNAGGRFADIIHANQQVISDAINSVISVVTDEKVQDEIYNKFGMHPRYIDSV